MPKKKGPSYRLDSQKKKRKPKATLKAKTTAKPKVTPKVKKPRVSKAKAKAKRRNSAILPTENLVNLVTIVETVVKKSSRRKAVVVKVQKQNPIKNIYDVHEIEDPLIGTPKEVQIELDGLALYMQKHPEDDVAFARIHTYVHKYLLGLVFKKFSFVRGNDENDIYQEALIAISKKAIPNFNPFKGMSFLNFAKMCINRHLITILHASNHRRKDMPINQAISLDQHPIDNDDGNCSLANVITDDKHSVPPYKEMANREAILRTLNSLRSRLSKFEIMALEQYLQDCSYKEAAQSITKSTGKRYKEKSVDNALLRIRKKAADILKECNAEELVPILF